MAKNILVDNRIILNGNRLFFIEPMESSATQMYIEVARYFATYGVKHLNSQAYNYIKHVQNFILWHYQFGSKYDTPFWNYAKKLKFIDSDFDDILKYSKKYNWKEIYRRVYDTSTPSYGQWAIYAFKLWYEGMTKKEK